MAVINDTYINNIYNNIPPIKRTSINSTLQDAYTQRSIINLYTNEEVINSTDIQRYYYDDWRLINSAQTGKVAKHFLFVLNNDFRNKGLAKQIHSNELAIYAHNQFKQIHLDASWDGVIVWKKLNFEYKYDFSETSIVAKWKEYINSELGFTGKDYFDIIKNIEKIAQIKKKYLRPLAQKSFTDWLSESHFLQEVPMYKNVA